MRETEVTFAADGGRLAGAYLRPDEGRFPAALVLGGSGPLDRNGDVKRMALSVSRDLALVLADNGWASLRYDKRGIGESEGDYLSTGLYEEYGDTRAALDWLMSQEGVGPVVVIGHSMGASMASELAVRAPGLAGVVMLAGIARRGEDVLVWQTGNVEQDVPKAVRAVMRLFGTSVVKQQKKSVTKIKDGSTDVARVMFAKTNAKWMREMFSYEPAETLSKIELPVLAITGSKDIQVDPADLQIIESLVSGATVIEMPDVDHLLRHEPNERSSLRRYRKQAQKPIDPRVTDAVVDWLSDLT